MATAQITNSTELRERLNELKQERQSHEEAIAQYLKVIHNAALNPAPYIKDLIHQLADDRNVKKDLLKTVLHFAANYVVDNYVYKNADTFLAGLLDKIRDTASGADRDDLIAQVLRFFNRK